MVRNMAFFRELLPQEKHPPSEFDFECARKLKASLVKKLLSLRKSKLSSWANEFRILRKYETERVIQVHLDWYCQNIGVQYVPEIQSGKAFKEKFDSLKSAKKRLSPLLIEDDTQLLVDKLKHHRWPGGLSKDLASCIQKSVNNYVEFLRKKTQLESMSIDDKWHKRYVKYFGEKLSSNPYSFVEEYMMELYHILQKWSQVPKTLEGFVFKPENVVFRQMGRTWSQERYSQIEMWETYIELIKDIE